MKTTENISQGSHYQTTVKCKSK